MNSRMKTAFGIAACSLSFFLCCMQWRSVLPLHTGPVELGQSDRPSCPAACRLQSGELLVVFPAGDSKNPRNTLMIRVHSMDGGKTWTSPRPIVIATRYAVHPSVVQLRNGRVLLVYGAANPKGDEPFSGFYLSASLDRGETFSEPRLVWVRGNDFLLPFDSALELDNGDLLLPVTVRKTGGIESVAVLVSKDQGQTWNEIRPVSGTSENTIGFSHPSLHRLENGKLMCVMETSGADDFLCQTVSGDSGKTWSAPVSTGVQGALPDWFQSPSGTVFLSCRDTWPKGLSLSRSYQFGAVWEKELSFLQTEDAILFHRMVQADSVRAFVLYFAGKPNSDVKLIARVFDAGKTKTPKGFSVSSRGHHQSVLRWNAVPSADCYFIYRGSRSNFDLEPGYPFTGNVLATPLEPEYTDANVDSGKTYFYRVTAVSGKGKVVSGTGSESDPTPAIGVKIK